MKHINNKSNFTENDKQVMLKIFDDNCILLESNCNIIGYEPYITSYGRYYIDFNYIFIYMGEVRKLLIQCNENSSITCEAIISMLNIHTKNIMFNIDNISNTKIYKDILKVYTEVQQDLKSYKLLSVLK